jgi:heme-degrading monooxygenase HmoA
LKEQRGFHGFVALVDRAGDRSIGYSVWETEEDMIASETSGNYREQIAKLGSVLAGPPNRDSYELVVIS